MSIMEFDVGVSPKDSVELFEKERRSFSNARIESEFPKLMQSLDEYSDTFGEFTALRSFHGTSAVLPQRAFPDFGSAVKSRVQWSEGSGHRLHVVVDASEPKSRTKVGVHALARAEKRIWFMLVVAGIFSGFVASMSVFAGIGLHPVAAFMAVGLVLVLCATVLLVRHDRRGSTRDRE